MKNVMASFTVGIQSREESIEGEFPFAFRLILVLKVILLEFGANINRDLELTANFVDILSTGAQSSCDHTAIDVFISPCDDLVASFLDQNHQSRRSVVVFAHLIDLEEGMHDGREEFRESGEFSSIITNLSEELSES
jgi:hypothetical protein